MPYSRVAYGYRRIARSISNKDGYYDDDDNYVGA